MKNQTFEHSEASKDRLSVDFKRTSASTKPKSWSGIFRASDFGEIPRPDFAVQSGRVYIVHVREANHTAIVISIKQQQTGPSFTESSAATKLDTGQALSRNKSPRLSGQEGGYLASRSILVWFASLPAISGRVYSLPPWDPRIAFFS